MQSLVSVVFSGWFGVGVVVEAFDKEKAWRTQDGRRGFLFTAGPIECSLSDHEIQEPPFQRRAVYI